MSRLPTSLLWTVRSAVFAPAAIDRVTGLFGTGSDWLLRRSVRVALLLSAVSLLNAFDLVFTILAARMGGLIELNPLAAVIVESGSHAALGAFKCLLVGPGLLVLWCCRRHRVSELGCWMLTLLFVGLSYRWYHYYNVYLAAAYG